ncbi:Uncharacterized conserved protein YcbK, DUF882 family [Bartonella apihabitans]|uniref:Murein endopeptidase K n=2 Tax=Bartonella apihabitans TaxID=2750929 RepID=A0A1U9M9C9_9HYPH|nr:Uncharacterized conserved protein YcbK, DUF882 family [Bartonella apihabitans]
MVVDGLRKSFWTFRRLSLAFVAMGTALSFMLAPVSAKAETRSLKLYYVHTGEKAEIVFKRDGKYDQAGLKRLNVFLRDWRRNEPTNMDPRLFDLIWSVYRTSGSREYINVVSAYRSPATNNMLRSRSANSGVAKNSQHTLGHAMDFYLPDVNLAKLRAIGLKQQVGGVGYYPRSGSPFVHMDVGNVRHWPRMSRSELMALFPDGKTMYIPSDGKPLSGYNEAKAEWLARRGAPVVYASASPAPQKRGFLSSLFGRKNSQEQSTEQPVRVQPSAPVVAEEPKTTTVVSLPKKDAPLPESSPLRGKGMKPTDEDEEETNEAPVMAYANVPVPTFKPDEGEDNETTVKLASVPLPESRPLRQDEADKVALAIANNGGETGKLSDKVPGDDLTALIEANEIIAVPDDDYEEDDDYADADDAQSPDESTVAALETNKSAEAPKTAPKVDRPDEEDVKNIISENENRIPASLTNSDMLAPDEELRKVPNVVFVSGLEKKQEVSRVAELRGRAIDFHAVARINDTY